MADESSTFAFLLMHPDAVLPKIQYEESAGYDLSSVDTMEIQPGDRALVDTGVAICMPPKKTWAHVLPRSGLALHHGIHVGGGV